MIRPDAISRHRDILCAFWHLPFKAKSRDHFVSILRDDSTVKMTIWPQGGDNGGFVYRPPAGFAGKVTFRYEALDAAAAGSEGEESLTPVPAGGGDQPERPAGVGAGS